MQQPSSRMPCFGPWIGEQDEGACEVVVGKEWIDGIERIGVKEFEIIPAVERFRLAQGHLEFFPTLLDSDMKVTIESCGPVDDVCVLAGADL